VVHIPQERGHDVCIADHRVRPSRHVAEDLIFATREVDESASHTHAAFVELDSQRSHHEFLTVPVPSNRQTPAPSKELPSVERIRDDIGRTRAQRARRRERLPALEHDEDGNALGPCLHVSDTLKFIRSPIHAIEHNKAERFVPRLQESRLQRCRLSRTQTNKAEQRA
jgi:hypothetical protein